MNKIFLILPTLCFSLNAFGSASSFDLDPSRRGRAAAPVRTVTPNDELILAVKGYQDTIVVATTLINPVVGLMASVYQGKESDDDLVGIRKALAKGADVNCRDALTWTPLMYAAYGGFPKIARFLIANGARKDLEITERGGLQNWKGYTAPKIAAYYLQKNKDLVAICKPERRDEYTKTIASYQELVDLLN